LDFVLGVSVSIVKIDEFAVVFFTGSDYILHQSPNP
jgi:hypothetical protein